MAGRFGTTHMKVTYSQTNHFMASLHFDDVVLSVTLAFSTFTTASWQTTQRIGLCIKCDHVCDCIPDTCRPPTTNKMMTYTDWLKKAEESLTLQNLESEHFYLQLADFSPHTFLRYCFDGMRRLSVPSGNGLRKTYQYSSRQRVFSSTSPTSTRLVQYLLLTISITSAIQGINCRFGNRGIIAENHYDSGRNFIAMLKGIDANRVFGVVTGNSVAGAKRYVLLPPEECKRVYLYPFGHPEGQCTACTSV